MILAVDAKCVEAVCDPGLTPCTAEQLTAWLPSDALWYGPRKVLETDERYRQLIPYVVVHKGPNVLMYGRVGGDGRLVGKRSVGWGGHVELSDAVKHGDTLSLVSTVERCARRELWEELELSVDGTGERWLGTLRADDTPVSRVHLGVVMLWELQDCQDVTSRDQSIADLRWARPSDLVHQPVGPYESWTRLVLEHLSYKGW